MAKWDFKIVGASFVKELAPVGDDVNPRSQSFMQPSFDLEGDKIVMKESGQYKTAILFTQIGEIDGVAPTDLEDAYAKLLVLVENFNGGGGAPGTTPNLTQVLTQGDVPIFIQQILEDAVVTIRLEWQVSQVYIYGEPTIGTGGIFLDKTVVFSDNATLRFCWGVQYEDGVFTKTPEPYEFTTDAIVYYNGSTITSLTIQPNDLVMLKSGGIVSPGENIWILTVTNNSTSPQNLAQTLAIDNKTNEIPIVSNNGSGYLNIGDDAVNLGYGTPNVKSIQIEADAFTLNSDVSIIINGGGLRIDSINYGLVIPRMTTAQKNAIASPQNSMLVYDITLSKFYQYNGSAWVVFGESGGAVDSVNGQTGVVVLDAGDVGADAITSATTGAVISFATPQVYNSIASPSSSNLTDNLTGARIGIVQKIYHNAGTAPTVPAGWVLRGTGTYVTSTLNIIYAEWSVGTTVEYWITQ